MVSFAGSAWHRSKGRSHGSQAGTPARGDNRNHSQQSSPQRRTTIIPMLRTTLGAVRRILFGNHKSKKRRRLRFRPGIESQHQDFMNSTHI
jgi:hypothetical protein